jgi:hypothetical protein
VAPTTVAGRSPEDTQRRAERKRVAKRRGEFLAEALAKRVPKAEATAYCLWALLDEAGVNALARAGGFLGLEPGSTKWGSRDCSTPLRQLAAASPGDLLRVALAVAAGSVEESISSYGSYGGRAAGYLGVLASLGYVLDGYEEAELAQATQDGDEEDAGPEETPDGESDAEGTGVDDVA